MTKALFNGKCIGCGEVRPRCAFVHFRIPGKATRYYPQMHKLCDDCRRLSNGKYRLADRHK